MTQLQKDAPGLRLAMVAVNQTTYRLGVAEVAKRN